MLKKDLILRGFEGERSSHPKAQVRNLRCCSKEEELKVRRNQWRML
jgi:hypothetical protein